MDEDLLRVAYIQMKIANEALEYSARCLQDVISMIEKSQDVNEQFLPSGHDPVRANTSSAEPAP